MYIVREPETIPELSNRVTSTPENESHHCLRSTRRNPASSDCVTHRVREHLRVLLWPVVSQRSIATTAVRTNDGIEYWNGIENSPGVSSKSYSGLLTRNHAQGQFWRQRESSKLYGPHWGNARDRCHCACRVVSVDFGLTSPNQS